MRLSEKQEKEDSDFVSRQGKEESLSKTGSEK